MAEPIALTAKQVAVLRAIQREGVTSYVEIAEVLGVSPPRAFNRVKSLVDAGLVAKRSKDDLRLTPRGDAALLNFRIAAYGDAGGMTHREIARALGVSAARIQQIEQLALAKLRKRGRELRQHLQGGA